MSFRKGTLRRAAAIGFALVTVAATVAVPLFECGAEAPDARLGLARSVGTLEWRQDPNLNAQQKARLEALEAETLGNGGAFHVEVWDRAGTVRRLHLAVNSPGATLEERAREFVRANAALWKVELAALVTAEIRQSDGCSRVVLQLRENGGTRPVVNATLTVSFSPGPGGLIRATVGRMDGRAFEVGTGGIAQSEADAVFRNFLGWPNSETPPAPVAAVFDPYFAGDSDHDGRGGWWYRPDLTGGSTPSTPANAPTHGIVVDSRSGEIVFNSITIPIENSTPTLSLCEEVDDATSWVADVVLDPLTETPASVIFRHFGGLAVSAPNDIERAYAALQIPVMVHLWGSHVAREHLRDASIVDLGSGWRTVNFREYVMGRPVDGSYLSVVLNPADRIPAMFARFIWAPMPPPEPVVAPSGAFSTALAAYISTVCVTTQCQQSLQSLYSQETPNSELIVLSSRIYEGFGSVTSDTLLAYRFDFPRAFVYVDAVAGTVVRQHLRVEAATYPYDIWFFGAGGPGGCSPTAPANECTVLMDRPEGAQLQVRSGTPFPPLDPDVAALDTILQEVDVFFDTQFQYKGPDGDGGLMFVNVPLEIRDLAAADFFRDPGLSAGVIVPQLSFGRGHIARDIFTHEFTHHVDNHNAGLVNHLEPGALGEAYSDLLAVAAFPPPDGGWEFGWASDAGSIRDLRDPAALGAGGVSHVADKVNCNAAVDPDECQYVWLGIPNRAATLIADGLPGNPSTAVGRLPLAHLYFLLLKDLMFGSDRFLNHREKLIGLCRTEATRGGVLGGRLIALQDCDTIAKAFDQVGVIALVRSGWSMFGGGYTQPDQTLCLFQGRLTFNGCAVDDHIITMEVTDGINGRHIQLSDAWSSPTQAHVLYGRSGDPSAEANIVPPRAADSNPSAREICYRVRTEWAGQPLFVWVDEQMSGPVPPAECVSPAGTTPVVIWSVAKTNQWAAGGGSRRNAAINVGSTSSCPVLEYSGTHQHKNDPFTPPLNPVDHGNHGYSVSAINGAGPLSNMLDVNLHTWNDWTSAIFARVAYEVAKPSGAPDGVCLTQGATVLPPP